MSIRVMSMVWENGPEKASERMLLLALADNANDAGGRCFPSVETLARKCCLSERQVQRVLRSLEEGGWILVEFGNGRHVTNQYQIVVEKVAYTPPVSPVTPWGDEPETVTSATETVTSATEKGDTHVTRTTREPSLQPPLATMAAFALDRETVDQKFDRWWKVVPKQVARGRARKTFSTAVKKVPVETLIDVTERGIGWNMERPIQFRPNPSTWLNDEHWLDDETTQRVVPEHDWAEWNQPDHTDYAALNRQLDEEQARKKSLEGTDHDA
jgi:Helix-turn-helix domain